MKYLSVPSISATMTKKLWFILNIVLVFQLYSCHPTFYIKITDISNPSHPCFSISQSRVFPWARGMGNVLEIQEVDRKGKYIQAVWVIEPVQNVDVKKLCYGKAPAGYKEIIKAIPLNLDKFYLFYPGGMGCYFIFVRENNEIKAKIYTRSEFYDKIVYSSKV